MTDGKTLRLDEARGIAIILVLVFHALGSEPVERGSLADYIAASLLFVRMPLFMVITGYLIGSRPIGKADLGTVLGKRLKRLLCPFLTLTLVCVVIDHRVGVNTGFLKALLYGEWHLWYIQALVVLTLVYIPVELIWRPSAINLGMATIVAAVVSATVASSVPKLFSLDHALALAPFWLFGVWLGRRPAALRSEKLRHGFYCLTALAILVHQCSLNGVGVAWSRTSLVATVIGAGAALFILRNAPGSSFLAMLGRYSFPIYLWHLPWNAVVSAAALRPLAIDGGYGVAIRVIVGIVMPIVVLELARHSRTFVLVFIGDTGGRGRRSGDHATATATAPHLS